jgi:hypothetical protein
MTEQPKSLTIETSSSEWLPREV